MHPILRPSRRTHAGSLPYLSLSVLLVACSGADVTSCPAADDGVRFGYGLNDTAVDAGSESQHFDRACTVVSANGGALALTCEAADDAQDIDDVPGSTVVEFSGSPAPDLAAFTPGLAVHVKFDGQYYEHSEDSLRITTAGGNLLFHGTANTGWFEPSDFAPLEFTNEAGCRPTERSCGFTTARASWTVIADGEEARVVDGSFARIGAYSLWVTRAQLTVRGDGDGSCSDYVPESYSMAVLYTP